MRDLSNEEPQNAIEHVLDAAIVAAEKLAEEAGGKVEQLAMFAHITGLGEQTGVSAGVGFEDSRELLSFLITQAQGLAKAHGIDMGLMEIDEPIGEG